MISTHRKGAMLKKRRAITQSLRKSGIHSLQEVLNTSILSDDAKIKHIRHAYTCYEKYLATFYRDQTGVELRKELNNFLLGLVNGEYTIDQFKEFNRYLKLKLDAANDNYIQTQKESLPNNNVKVIEQEKVYTEEQKEIDYVNQQLQRDDLLKIEKCAIILGKTLESFSENEKNALLKVPDDVLYSKRSLAHKANCIQSIIENIKYSWRSTYKYLAKTQTLSINKYLIELYLENRSSTFYPKDFSDLDFLSWSMVKDKALNWLLNRFDNDKEKYEEFLEISLPNWIQANFDKHEDKILELL